MLEEAGDARFGVRRRGGRSRGLGVCGDDAGQGRAQDKKGQRRTAEHGILMKTRLVDMPEFHKDSSIAINKL
jgi:hypothetical protein